MLSKKNWTSLQLSQNLRQFNSPLLPTENRIHVIRHQQVMLDSDLARLYGVETRVLNQAVKRNIERFPEDFMFQLSKEESQNLISQIVTSSSRSQNVTLNKGLKSINFSSTSTGLRGLSYQVCHVDFLVLAAHAQGECHLVLDD